MRLQLLIRQLYFSISGKDASGNLYFFKW